MSHGGGEGGSRSLTSVTRGSQKRLKRRFIFSLLQIKKQFGEPTIMEIVFSKVKNNSELIVHQLFPLKHNDNDSRHL